MHIFGKNILKISTIFKVKLKYKNLRELQMEKVKKEGVVKIKKVKRVREEMILNRTQMLAPITLVMILIMSSIRTALINN